MIVRIGTYDSLDQYVSTYDSSDQCQIHGSDEYMFGFG